MNKFVAILAQSGAVPGADISAHRACAACGCAAGTTVEIVLAQRNARDPALPDPHRW